jgi:hypothetical protein
VDTVQFKEVHASFLKAAHNYDDEWAVNEANTMANGHWVSVELKDSDIPVIMLPAHWHPHGVGQELIAANGAALFEVLQTLGANPKYCYTNKGCWGLLEHLKEDSQPIILSTKPLQHPNYIGLQALDSHHLFHIDGLHRLLAWQLFKSRHTLQAYIAQC